MRQLFAMVAYYGYPEVQKVELKGAASFGEAAELLRNVLKELPVYEVKVVTTTSDPR